MRTEFSGSILAVRAVEDCIRATHQYTKGLKNPLSGRTKRPVAIQGEDFPSAVLTEHYEVYPDTDIEEIMPLGQAIWKTLDWLGGDVVHIGVQFRYDYRGGNREGDKAKVTIEGGNGVIRALEVGIPGFTEALATVGAVNGDSTP